MNTSVRTVRLDTDQMDPLMTVAIFLKRVTDNMGADGVDVRLVTKNSFMRLRMVFHTPMEILIFLRAAIHHEWFATVIRTRRDDDTTNIAIIHHRQGWVATVGDASWHKTVVDWCGPYIPSNEFSKTTDGDLKDAALWLSRYTKQGTANLLTHSSNHPVAQRA